jgi:protoporphyrin/coproporphyrin ferrochelatase
VTRTGVLLQGYGGPATVDDVRPFMCNLMGREPSDELVTRICANYEAIGGGSPLLGIAEEIASLLTVRLEANGHNVPVRVGMRYWEPYIADSVADLIAQGCDRIVAVSLSAFESEIATGAYRKAIQPMIDAHPELTVVQAPLVGANPAYAEFFARSVREALALLGTADAVVVFSAHSLPLTDVVHDDPYVVGIERTAREVAALLDLGAAQTDAGGRLSGDLSTIGSDEGEHPWYLAYQSKGARPGGWLGPELDTVLDGAAGVGASGVAVVPIGFMTDHMETLWDLDIVAAKRAADAQLPFARAAVPNTDAALLDAIVASVEPLL